MSGAAILGLIGTLFSSALAAVFGYLGIRKKSKLDVEAIFTAEMKTILAEYKDQINELKAEVGKLKDEINLLRAENKNLRSGQK